MQGETAESAERGDEFRTIGSEGRAANTLKAVIDARWKQTGPE